MLPPLTGLDDSVIGEDSSGEFLGRLDNDDDPGELNSQELDGHGGLHSGGRALGELDSGRLDDLGELDSGGLNNLGALDSGGLDDLGELDLGEMDNLRTRFKRVG